MAGAETPDARSGHRGIALGALVVLAGLAAYAFLMSPSFRLQRIEVTGTTHVTPGRVEWATGLQAGDLRWRHPEDEIRQRLLAAEPWLAEAEVRWQHGGVLTVAASERRPVALIPYFNMVAVLDAEGRVLELGDLAEYPLPVVTGVTVQRGLRGDRIGDPRLQGALEAAALLPAALAPDLAEIHLNESDELSLLFTGSLVARLGLVGELDAKLVALASVYADARRDHMDIELSSASRPVLVPRSPRP